MARARTTGGGLRRGLALRRAGVRAHLLGQTGGAGTAQACRKQARGGGRISGVHGVAATVQGRPNGRVIRAHGDSLSALTCSEASLRGRSRGGGMAGSEELSAPVKLGLHGAKEAGKRGVGSRSSQRIR